MGVWRTLDCQGQTEHARTGNRGLPRKPAKELLVSMVLNILNSPGFLQSYYAACLRTEVRRRPRAGRLCLAIPVFCVIVETMKTLKVHFDGRVLVPDEPVDLPLNRPLELSVVSLDKPLGAVAALDKLAALAQKYPIRSSKLGDLAAQHDHYLYGTSKRP
jgi:hypothetical protein